MTEIEARIASPSPHGCDGCLPAIRTESRPSGHDNMSDVRKRCCSLCRLIACWHNPKMRLANIITFVAIGLWLGLLWIGTNLIKGVIAQNVKGYPGSGQVDFLIVIPLKVITVVFLVATLINLSKRFEIVLLVIAGLALASILPYLFVYGGGV